MNTIQKISLIVLGLCVLITYYIIFVRMYKSSQPYHKHELWFGMKPTLVCTIIPFQLFAAIGFLVSIISWFNNPPESGLMSKRHVLYITYVFFFIGSIIWPIAVYTKHKIITVSSLVLVAITSILLLAGSIEEKNPRIHIVIGLIYVNIVTVLLDAVIWNANYITKNKKK